VRLAARLRGRLRIRWGHALGFGAIVGAVAVFVRVATYGLNLPIVAAVLTIVAAVTTQIVFGGRFFSTRATTQDGEPVGQRRAREVMGLTLALYFGVLSLFLIVRLLIRWRSGDQAAVDLVLRRLTRAMAAAIRTTSSPVPEPASLSEALQLHPPAVFA